MVSFLVVNRLKTLVKPKVVLFSQGFRYEGTVICLDDEYLELYDDVRCYRKFIKLGLIDELEVSE